MNYRKIPKISPGAYIFQRPFSRGLSTDRNLHFKIDWASLIVGSKFTVFSLFNFVFEGNNIFQVQGPGGLYLEGRFNGGFFALLVWGAYIWRGLFSEFYGMFNWLFLSPNAPPPSWLPSLLIISISKHKVRHFCQLRSVVCHMPLDRKGRTHAYSWTISHAKLTIIVSFAYSLTINAKNWIKI